MKNIVSITGYGVVSSLGIGKEETRKKLFDGVSGISDLTLAYADRNVTSAFGAVTQDLPMDSFFSEQNMKPDRVFLLAMSAANEAVLQSGILLAGVNVLKIGVVVGTSLGGMLSGDKFHTSWLTEGIEKADVSLIKQYPLHAVGDVLAKKYGFQGTKMIISTACASGANALTLASDLIQDGLCEIVLAGGVDPISRFSFAGFTSLGAINRNPCQPYSNSKGINIGEGAAFFVLEGQRSLQNRNGAVLAEIKGYGNTADAYHPTAPNISGNGAVRSMNMALWNAGIGTHQISYINGHGTGTPANDSAEKKAWKTFVGEDTQLPLISNKGSVGHCMGAAGAVEIAFSLLSLEEQTIPPTLRFDQVSEPEINFVPNKAIQAKVTNVLSNSFAFGGNNCSVMVSLPGGVSAPAVTGEKQERIVITGLGCVGVGGKSVEEFFEMLSGGTTNFETLNLCGKDYSSPYIGKSDIDDTFFKKFILPKSLRRLDKITKLTMSSGRQALMDSKILITQENSHRIGVIYGTDTGPSNTIKTISEHMIRVGIDGISSDLFANSVLNAAPGQFSIANNLKGVTSTVSSGLASGLDAFIYATMLLKSGQADAIIVISADEWDDTIQVGKERLGLLSKGGNLPFSDQADGMILSEGSVAFVLTKKNYAEEQNLKIYAEVKGYFSNSNNPPLSDFDYEGDQWKEGFAGSLKSLGNPCIDYYASTSIGLKGLDQQEAELIHALMPGSVVRSIPRLIGTPFGSLGCYGLLSCIYSLMKHQPPGVGSVADAADEYKDLLVRKNGTDIHYAATSVASFGGAYAGVILGDIL